MIVTCLLEIRFSIALKSLVFAWQITDTNVEFSIFFNERIMMFIIREDKNSKTVISNFGIYLI